mmetsp:Transcript_10612/g.23666  ORF Transcript_10612/g.23666 Transcript_10612/m.23666 type:complete len:326 (+) Transcript_10612:46-1023(+)
MPYPEHCSVDSQVRSGSWSFTMSRPLCRNRFLSSCLLLCDLAISVSLLPALLSSLLLALKTGSGAASSGTSCFGNRGLISWVITAAASSLACNFAPEVPLLSTPSRTAPSKASSSSGCLDAFCPLSKPCMGGSSSSLVTRPPTATGSGLASPTRWGRRFADMGRCGLPLLADGAGESAGGLSESSHAPIPPAGIDSLCRTLDARGIADVGRWALRGPAGVAMLLSSAASPCRLALSGQLLKIAACSGASLRTCFTQQPSGPESGDCGTAPGGSDPGGEPASHPPAPSRSSFTTGPMSGDILPSTVGPSQGCLAESSGGGGDGRRD